MYHNHHYQRLRKYSGREKQQKGKGDAEEESGKGGIGIVWQAKICYTYMQKENAMTYHFAV